MKNSKLKRESRNVQNNTTAALVEDFPVVVKQEVKEEEEYNTIKTRLRSNVVVDQQRISPRTAPLPVVTSKATMPKLSPKKKTGHQFRSHCYQLEFKYSRKQIYMKHLRRKYNIVRAKKQLSRTAATNPNVLPDINDVNNYCKSCEYTFSTKSTYKEHLKVVHNIISANKRLIPKANPNALPNINDPNNYCSSCQYTFSRKSVYNAHLKRVQNLMPADDDLRFRKPNLDVLPDINDPNNYCLSCQHTFSTKHKYKMHLRVVHHLNIPFQRPRRVNIKPGVIPDWNNKRNYCCVCDRTSKNLMAFRAHLRVVHRITSRSTVKQESSATRTN